MIHDTILVVLEKKGKLLEFADFIKDYCNQYVNLKIITASCHIGMANFWRKSLDNNSNSEKKLVAISIILKHIKSAVKETIFMNYYTGGNKPECEIYAEEKSQEFIGKYIQHALTLIQKNNGIPT